LAEIHVIVAGDEPIIHVIFPSMDVSRRRTAAGPGPAAFRRARVVSILNRKYPH